MLFKENEFAFKEVINKKKIEILINFFKLLRDICSFFVCPNTKKCSQTRKAYIKNYK